MNPNKIFIISLVLLLFGFIVLGGCTGPQQVPQQEPQQIQKSRSDLITANLSQIVTLDDFPEGWRCDSDNRVKQSDPRIIPNPNITTYLFDFSKGAYVIQIDIAQWNTIENAKYWDMGSRIPFRLYNVTINIGEDSHAYTGMQYIDNDPNKNLTINYRNRNVEVLVHSSETDDLENLTTLANLVNQRLENY